MRSSESRMGIQRVFPPDAPLSSNSKWFLTRSLPQLPLKNPHNFRNLQESLVWSRCWAERPPSQCVRTQSASCRWGSGSARAWGRTSRCAPRWWQRWIPESCQCRAEFLAIFWRIRNQWGLTCFSIWSQKRSGLLSWSQKHLEPTSCTS